METRFLLIRHGLCDPVGKSLSGRAPGVLLNEQGRRQAQELARSLAASPLRAIYSSPLERARQTAEPLSRELALELRIRDSLTDLDFGRWSGHAITDLAQDPQWGRFNSFRSFTRIPGGEAMIEVQSRMLREIEQLCAIHPDQEIALFSHADPIKAVLAFGLGMGLDQLSRIEISPASVSVLAVADWGFRILGVNHLGPLS